MIVLAPSTVQEMADFVGLGFDLSFKYRTPSMILADGIVGQMMEKVVLPRPGHVVQMKRCAASARGRPQASMAAASAMWLHRWRWIPLRWKRTTSDSRRHTAL